jgi:hypothetical protein
MNWKTGKGFSNGVLGSGAEESAVAGNTADTDESTPEVSDKPPTELTPKTGFINDTDPVTKLSALMDIVYLPDFEEQFVIQPRNFRAMVTRWENETAPLIHL